MITTLDNRKQRLEDMKKSPGRDTRNYVYWYEMLKGMPFREKTTIELSDLTGFTGLGIADLTVLELPAGAELLSAFINVRIPLAGGVLAAATISLGSAGAAYDQLVQAGDAFTAGIRKVIGTDLTTNRGVYDMAGDTDIKVQVILDADAGEHFENLTAGEIDIHYTYVEHG